MSVIAYSGMRAEGARHLLPPHYGKSGNKWNGGTWELTLSVHRAAAPRHSNSRQVVPSSASCCTLYLSRTSENDSGIHCSTMRHVTISTRLRVTLGDALHSCPNRFNHSRSPQDLRLGTQNSWFENIMASSYRTTALANLRDQT